MRWGRPALGRRRPTPGRPDNAPQFAKLSPAAIAEFKANPLALLTTYASAGLPLTTEVRSLVLTDPSLIDDLITAAKSGSDAQKAAIGAGLAQASRILARSNPQTADDDPAEGRASGLLPLITAFIAGSNGVETAAVGGGGRRSGGWRRRPDRRRERRRRQRRRQYGRRRGHGRQRFDRQRLHGKFGGWRDGIRQRRDDQWRHDDHDHDIGQPDPLGVTPTVATSASMRPYPEPGRKTRVHKC